MMLTKKTKCGICKKKIESDNPYKIVLRTNDAQNEILVCDECSMLLDTIETRINEKLHDKNKDEG
jgi:hypothetical protein